MPSRSYIQLGPINPHQTKLQPLPIHPIPLCLKIIPKKIQCILSSEIHYWGIVIICNTKKEYDDHLQDAVNNSQHGRSTEISLQKYCILFRHYFNKDFLISLYGVWHCNDYEIFRNFFPGDLTGNYLDLEGIL
jgi:hypothetical protein